MGFQATIEIAKVRPIFRDEFNFSVHIWEQNTETEKTNGFWEDIVYQNKFHLR